MSKARNPERAALLEEGELLVQDARFAGYTALVVLIPPEDAARVQVFYQATDSRAHNELLSSLKELAQRLKYRPDLSGAP